MQRTRSTCLTIIVAGLRAECRPRQETPEECASPFGHGKAVARALASILLTTMALACDQPPTATPMRQAPSRDLVSGPISDRTMGPLSELARRVSIAMQDPDARGAVVRAMKDSTSRQVGLDLTDCGTKSATRELFTAAEKRGAGLASTACADIAQRGSLLLYMAPDRLAAWDSTLVPIVTAVADLEADIPASFRGYRSPDVIIDIPSDGSLLGPILVIVPVLHPKRNASRPPRVLPTSEIRAQLRPSDTGRVFMPDVPLRPNERLRN
jgi:hypothetical protein